MPHRPTREDWLLRYGADSLGWNWPVDFLFASIVIIWLVINELLSILENVSARCV